MPDNILPLLLKLSVLIKVYVPGLLGTALNFLLKQHIRASSGLAKASMGAKLGTAIAAFLIGLGCVWIAEAYINFRKLPPNPLIIKAVFFVGATGGVELIFWIIGKAERASTLLEEAYMDRLLTRREKNHARKKENTSKK